MFGSRDEKPITLWLQELKEGSDAAASDLWAQYFEKLVAVAKRRLSNAPKRVSDEEDVALNVFRSLCEGVEQGRFNELNDREDLWKLLLAMTRHKSMNQVRDQRAQKRGSGQVAGNSIFASDMQGFEAIWSEDPTPEFLVEVEEEQTRLLNLLQGKNHRAIAELRLQGFSVEETASQLGISPRSVKRKLALIRETWAAEFEHSS